MLLSNSSNPERNPPSAEVVHRQLGDIASEVYSLCASLRERLPEHYGYFRRTGLFELGWERMQLAPVDGKLLRIGSEVTLFEAGMTISLNYREDRLKGISEVTITRNDQIIYWVLRNGETLHNRTLDRAMVRCEPNLVESLALATKVLAASKRCKEFYCDHPVGSLLADKNSRGPQ